MKNLSIFILEHFFLSLAFIEEVRQNISRSINFFLIITNSEVISKKLLSLTNLTKAQTFHIYELTEVIIVSKDKHLVFAAFQVVASSLKSLNNC